MRRVGYGAMVVALVAIVAIAGAATQLMANEPSKKEQRLIANIDKKLTQLSSEQGRRLAQEIGQAQEADAEAQGAEAQGPQEGQGGQGALESHEALAAQTTAAQQKALSKAAAAATRQQRDLAFDFNPVHVDSMLCRWREAEAELQFNDFFKSYIDIGAQLEDPKALSAREAKSNAKLDSLYRARLAALASPIELPYNSIVRSYINRYINPESPLMSNVLARSKYYFPDIEEQLIKHNLPVELRAMAIIESALTTAALSHAGAMGLWQFMPATGRMYKLEVNSLIDERCDPAKATVAACRFMGDLYKMYGDWSLAIAAYNCGPGNVNKALARSGLKRGTYWDIYEHLPRETRGYVPAFIAATYAYAYHQQHGIKSGAAPLPLATDTVTVRKITHLEQVSSTIDVSLELLRQLNPQYRKDIIPATTKSYALVLPRRQVSNYIKREAEIMAKDKQYLKGYVEPQNIEKLKNPPAAKVHVVKSGESLSVIAKRYKVTTKQLMAWNNIKNVHKVYVGQRLKVGA